MNKLIYLLLFLAGVSIPVKANKEGDELFEYRLRNGLPNFIYKAKQGDSVRVAYFGGSITEQRGWRVQSFEYLKNKFPEAKIEQINAAMGGTGSLLGVLRMDRDVLPKKPDLVFVEFAVNDSQTEPEQIMCTMEGIVRKIRKNSPYCDICFVYTTTESILQENTADKLHPAAQAMEEVAAWYGIPSVYMPFEVLALLKKGGLEMKIPKGVVAKVSGNELDESFQPRKEENGIIYFSPDGVHPYLNTGHVLYTNVLKKGLDAMYNQSGHLKKYKLKKALSKDNYEYTEALSIEKLQPDKQWTEQTEDSSLFKSYSYRFQSLWVGEVGATLEFSFKGESLICYDLITPEGCLLEVTVDGKKSIVNRFDGYCTYWRYHYAELVSGLDKKKEHRVFIKVIDEGLDKREILFEENRPDFINNPAKYEPVRWYLSTIFAVH